MKASLPVSVAAFLALMLFLPAAASASPSVAGSVAYTYDMCSGALSTGNAPGSNGNSGCNIQPTDIFVNPVNGQIYVSDANASNPGGESMALLSASTDKVTGGVVGPYLPSQYVYDQANGKIYVATYYGYPYSNQTGTTYVAYMYVLNAATGAYEGNISYGRSFDNQLQGWGIALDPANGNIYADTYAGNQASLSVISTATDRLVKTIPGFGSCGSAGSCTPAGVFYDPASGHIYVGHDYVSNVTVVDPSTGAVIGTITKFSNSNAGPSSFFYDQKDGLVYAADYGGTVTVIGAGNDSVINTLGAASFNYQTGKVTFYGGGIYNGSSPWGIAYVPSLDYIYVSNQGSDNVTVVDCATNTIVGNIAVGGGGGGSFPEGIAYDQANGRIYLAESHSDTITVITPAASSETTTTTTATSPPTSTATSSSSAPRSSTSTAQSSGAPSTTTGTPASTTGGGGGVPEFPGQLLAASALTVLLVASYAMLRGRVRRLKPATTG